MDTDLDVPVADKCVHFVINKLNHASRRSNNGDDQNNEDDDDDDSYVLDEQALDEYERLLPASASHGDMVIIGAKRLRSQHVYFVSSFYVELIDQVLQYNGDHGDTCDSTATNATADVVARTNASELRLLRKLVQKDPSGGAGYCCVPAEVAAKIADPVRFYAGAFNYADLDEVDFSGIEMDTRVHQHLLIKYTHGKPVADNRKCFYFLSNNEWDSSGGMFIWCDFFLDDFDSGRYVRLSGDMAVEDLAARPVHRRDLPMLVSAAEMKRHYEDTFTRSLAASAVDAELELYGSTFFCPRSREPNGGTVLTMRFSRAETEPCGQQISAIYLRHLPQEDAEADNETMNATTMNTTTTTTTTTMTSGEFKFTQRVLTEYGRFGGVALWCSDASASASVGIMSPDDANTYVICTADLFVC